MKLGQLNMEIDFPFSHTAVAVASSFSKLLILLLAHLEALAPSGKSNSAGCAGGRWQLINGTAGLAVRSQPPYSEFS